MSFIIKGTKDLMKPSTIKDLRVYKLDTKNQLLTLKFTAPGDNADLGTGIFFCLIT